MSAGPRVPGSPLGAPAAISGQDGGREVARIGPSTGSGQDTRKALTSGEMAIRYASLRWLAPGGVRKFCGAPAKQKAGEGIRTLDVQLGKRRYSQSNALLRRRLWRSHNLGDQLGAHLHDAGRRGQEACPFHKLRPPYSTGTDGRCHLGVWRAGEAISDLISAACTTATAGLRDCGEP